MLYLGQRLQDKATSPHLLSPLHPPNSPNLPRVLVQTCHHGAQGGRQLTPVLFCWNPLRHQGDRPEGGKSGLRNCASTLCHFKATLGGLSAADICRIIFMLLQSSSGLKSKIQKVSSALSWSLTFFAGDNCSKAGTLALICQKQRSFWVSCSFMALGNRQ